MEVIPTADGMARVRTAAISRSPDNSARAPTKRSSVATASIRAMIVVFVLDLDMDDLDLGGHVVQRHGARCDEGGSGAGDGAFLHAREDVVGAG